MAMEPKVGEGLEIKPHTKAKHNILERYLGIWVTILGSRNKTLAYIDGFAGPGIYRGGEPGSPIIALREASKAKHTGALPSVHFWFIEKKKKHVASLCNKITNTMDELLDHIIIHGVKKTEFELGFKDIVDELSRHGKIPAFAFVDPFGYSHVKMETLVRFLKAPKREILFTFMVGPLNRFTKKEKEREKLDEVFGTSEWKNYGERTGEEKMYYLREMYVAQFEKHGLECLKFEMHDKQNKQIYSLIFVTEHIAGLRVMKSAMSRAMSQAMSSAMYRAMSRATSSVDDGYQLIFSDADDLHQPSMLQYIDIDYDAYTARRIYEKFHGRQSVPVDEVELFVIKHIPDTFKKKALHILEDADPPKITGVVTLRKRRKHTYPDGCRISFSKKQ